MENPTADTETGSVTVFGNDYQVHETRNETMNKTSNVKIRITFDKKEIVISMYDNPTSRDFVSLLPLQVTLDDFAGAEKISTLPKKLTTDDAPAGSLPSIGKLTYYSPWGNMALFYKDARYADGLIMLGETESGTDNIASIQSSALVNISKID
jgi:hypothetical protein